MPEIDVTSPTLADILAFQKETGMSDKDLGLALIGPVEDPAKKVRAWKSDTADPTLANIQAFRYLKALVAIVRLNPSFADEMYQRAFSALPRSLQ